MVARNHCAIFRMSGKQWSVWQMYSCCELAGANFIRSLPRSNVPDRAAKGCTSRLEFHNKGPFISVLCLSTEAVLYDYFSRSCCLQGGTLGLRASQKRLAWNSGIATSVYRIRKQIMNPRYLAFEWSRTINFQAFFEVVEMFHQAR